jgi:hypothetical protein
LALWATIAAHNEPEYLNTAAITAPKMKMVTTRSADSWCSASDAAFQNAQSIRPGSGR